MATNIPRTGSIWKHYKGDTYRIEGWGLLEGSATIMVIYCQSNLASAPTWIRPLHEWNAHVPSYGDRFTEVVDN